MSDQEKKPAPPQASPPSSDAKEKKPPTRIEIPLISVPDETAEIEEEMEALFNEEKVKHRHGGTEPERD